MREILIARAQALHHDTSGHADLLLADVLLVIGIVILGAGAAAGEDVIIIVGTVVLALGFIARSVIGHMKVDYPIYDRLNALEKDDTADD
ncbi:MAG: hypothetical protein DK306_001635 [Chloroflexi bacterium]|jgi:hypothetical protein|nr:MAG: hypothetical protein DK306_001635 [Chloroflexota bacterium]